MNTDKITLTDEEIENIRDVKLRGEKRREKWRIDNPERANELDERSKNRRKYSSSGVYYEKLPKNYLHNESYEIRLAKAEALNGCKFRPAREYKSKRWGYPVNREQRNNGDGHANNCDGQSALSASICFKEISLNSFSFCQTLSVIRVIHMNVCLRWSPPKSPAF
jgi:hypothetical protein